MHSSSILAGLKLQEREIVVAFFGIFAGAEFTLKQRGFIKSGGHSGAMADWDTFALSIAGQFREQHDPSFQSAWRTLSMNAPRKQVVRNGSLSWREANRPRGCSDEQWGLLMVRRVRNNLFHGGKFVLGGTEAPNARDVMLVRSALVLVERALTLSFARPAIRDDTESQ